MRKTTYTLAEAADILSCHSETLRRAIKEGVLSAARLGREYRISRNDLQTFWSERGGGELFAEATGLLQEPETAPTALMAVEEAAPTALIAVEETAPTALIAVEETAPTALIAAEETTPTNGPRQLSLLAPED